MSTRNLLRALVLLAGAVAFSAANAVTYTTVAGTSPDFPMGDISFADQLISLTGGLVIDADGTGPFPGPIQVPIPAARNASTALGVPDLTQTAFITCGLSVNGGNPNWVPGCNAVSLGVGGVLIVKFTDNFLTGSDSTALDLWIFEAGPDIEDTFVDISKNGTDWSAVGKVLGSTAGVDIDAFGFTSADLFSYVRLTDDPAEGDIDGATVGADIDAIGAITTAAVPAPAGIWLLLTGVAGLAFRRLHR